MPHQINNHHRVDELVRATLHLVGTEGVQGLTLRRLAATARVHPSSLLSHLDSKHRILDLITKRVGDELVRSIDADSIRGELEAAVPDDELLPVVRAWLALSELARADEDHAAGVARVEADLRHLLGRIAGLPAEDDAGRDALMALTRGLWVARCAPPAPMSEDRARAALRHAGVALGIDAWPETRAA